MTAKNIKITAVFITAAIIGGILCGSDAEEATKTGAIRAFYETSEQSLDAENKIAHARILPVEKTLYREPAPASESLGTFKIYHYCAGYITATGTSPTPGRTIAVDPNVIPLGSKVIINGHEYIAEDTGGDIIGNTIDVFVESEAEAFANGVKYLEVSIVREAASNV